MFETTISDNSIGRTQGAALKRDLTTDALYPAEQTALTVALAQVDTGELDPKRRRPTCVRALARIVGRAS